VHGGIKQLVPSEMTMNALEGLDRRLKVWRRLLGTVAPYEVKAITIVESSVFAPQRIELARVVAFIGLHGTGKTLLLRMLDSAFGYSNYSQTPPFIKGDQSTEDAQGIDGVVELEVQTSSGLIKRRIDLTSARESRAEIWANELPANFGGVYASPIYMFAELAILFQNYSWETTHFGETDRSELKTSRVRVINEILGRSYDHIQIYSKSDEDAQFYGPYVVASGGDSRIDSSMMSQGELWVHYVLSWLLDIEASLGDLLLLDEPESFLAPRAQRPFIDEMARQVLANESQLIIGTHSPEVLARFPLDNIRMCINSDDGIRVIKPSSVVQIRESIGLETAIRMVILVEDELAATLLRGLFARYDIALNRETEVVAAEGEATVIRGLEALQKLRRLNCAGVLDADQKARPANARGLPVYFLPGASAPEIELTSAAGRAADVLANRLSVAPNDVRAAISACSGMDHQRWMSVIAGHLSLPEPVLVHELVQVWLLEPQISEAAAILVQSLRARLLSPGD
jgi:AAA domain, putative AbiEii toxin, Type IV TA system